MLLVDSLCPLFVHWACCFCCVLFICIQYSTHYYYQYIVLEDLFCDYGGVVLWKREGYRWWGEGKKGEEAEMSCVGSRGEEEGWEIREKGWGMREERWGIGRRSERWDEGGEMWCGEEGKVREQCGGKTDEVWGRRVEGLKEVEWGRWGEGRGVREVRWRRCGEGGSMREDYNKLSYGFGGVILWF